MFRNQKERFISNNETPPFFTTRYTDDNIIRHHDTLADLQPGRQMEYSEFVQEDEDSDLNIDDIQAKTGKGRKLQYRKTKVCPWNQRGKCYMGDTCNYAHTKLELRYKPDLSRTKICPELEKNHQCEDRNCRFAHSLSDLRATNAFFKTKLCKFWIKGSCPSGVNCRHAHGRDEVRNPDNIPPRNADMTPADMLTFYSNQLRNALSQIYENCDLDLNKVDVHKIKSVDTSEPKLLVTGANENQKKYSSVDVQTKNTRDVSASSKDRNRSPVITNSLPKTTIPIVSEPKVTKPQQQQQPQDIDRQMDKLMDSENPNVDDPELLQYLKTYALMVLAEIKVRENNTLTNSLHDEDASQSTSNPSVHFTKGFKSKEDVFDTRDLVKAEITPTKCLDSDQNSDNLRRRRERLNRGEVSSLLGNAFEGAHRRLTSDHAKRLSPSLSSNSPKPRGIQSNSENRSTSNTYRKSVVFDSSEYSEASKLTGCNSECPTSFIAEPVESDADGLDAINDSNSFLGNQNNPKLLWTSTHDDRSTTDSPSISVSPRNGNTVAKDQYDGQENINALLYDKDIGSLDLKILCDQIMTSSEMLYEEQAQDLIPTNYLNSNSSVVNLPTYFNASQFQYFVDSFEDFGDCYQHLCACGNTPNLCKCFAYNNSNICTFSNPAAADSTSGAAACIIRDMQGSW